MLDHTGRYRVRYEDALRALGHYLDQHRFTRILLVETPEGFLLKGYVVSDDREGTMHLSPETYLFTNEDIDILLEQAYARRRSPHQHP